jgi:hypothetical protein
LSPSREQDSLGIYSSEEPGGGKLVKPARIIIVRHGESMGNLDEVREVHEEHLQCSKDGAPLHVHGWTTKFCLFN